MENGGCSEVSTFLGELGDQTPLKAHSVPDCHGG